MQYIEILRYLEEYLKYKNINIVKRGNVRMTDCPTCKNNLCSATIIPNSHIINCFSCKNKFDLIQTIKLLEEDKKNYTDEELIQYIKELFNLNIITTKDDEEILQKLDLYEKLGFDLVPIVKNGKIPIEREWTIKSHKDKTEWRRWVGNFINIGVKTGKISNITVLDIDTINIPEEIKKYCENTLIQKTLKGWHIFFKYVEELPKTRIDSLKIDVENDGGQVVIEPSIVEEHKRKFNDYIEIKEMPKDLVDFLKEKIKLPRLKTDSEKLREDIENENFQIDLVNEGNRNDILVRLMGIYRKRLNFEQTRFAVHVFNKHFCTPAKPSREIEAMLRNGEKYIQHDEDELAKSIISYLEAAKKASKAEIEVYCFGNRAKGEDRKRIDKCLIYLLSKNIILREGREYILLERMEWQDTLLDIGIPVNFEVPYFQSYAYFNLGDIILIGSKTKFGKTTSAMNIIHRLVKQNIKPYYIYNETGGRFAKTALHLGMKDGDFHHIYCTNPEKVILEPNSVVIYDWMKPQDFSRTDNSYEMLSEKAQKSNSFLIVFAQLKVDNSFFAPNQIGQFPALVTKYIYEDEKDGTYTKFEICDVRDGKMIGKHFEIPCIYNWDTKLLFTKEELEK